MARNHKHNPRRRTRPPQDGNGISRGTSFGVGVGVGAIITALIFVNGAKLSVDDIAERFSGDDGKAVEKATRFEFYTVLPGKEMMVPDAPPAPPRKTASTTEPAKVEPAARSGKDGDNYMLQAGSFKKAADADSLKARLALLGLEAGIQKVNLGEQGIWHRVRLGPYPGRTRADEVKRLLESNSIKVLTTRPR